MEDELAENILTIVTNRDAHFLTALYQHQIVMLKRIPFLRGMTPWIFKDFRGPRRTLPRFENYFNRKGLISDHGEKKELRKHGRSALLIAASLAPTRVGKGALDCTLARWLIDGDGYRGGMA